MSVTEDGKAPNHIDALLRLHDGAVRWVTKEDHDDCDAVKEPIAGTTWCVYCNECVGKGEIYDSEDHPDSHFVATDNDHFMIRTWGRGTRRVDGIK